MSVQISIRLPDDLASWIDNQLTSSGVSGQTRNNLIVSMLEESKRMRMFPGIIFVDGPAGRRPRLFTGPDVWEVVICLLDISENNTPPYTEYISEYFNIPSQLVDSALQYYLEYRSEIDAWIEQNNKAAIEAHLIWAKVNEDLN